MVVTLRGQVGDLVLSVVVVEPRSKHEHAPTPLHSMEAMHVADHLAHLSLVTRIIVQVCP